ncbi:2-hydroxyacid dehydrogenase [Flavobacterium gawalongense]|uniref:2-hydroxyacid dehydrogenase n=1 Tax=Flavobacterium gawalongense TaxID=2594432 RepID=A0A553BPH0_9FLAO|nr:2-hydroxyacid dehydrogenase [Flavobacterium gawalongense]TRX01525.1 2-hydroxyacid dehydrogenase [Flavobacterium gawalongense]TRX06124.1 2-hydroxyacid dehydrogenase [Flavobacterium gawalongense]TRX10121.1 2-hydroxyacid dehydrogenase [Flavobacterium gawalongense]TRX11134.1 2-hydroxyacid dehydrogenase [Flavobacterium gawalongense]TRX28783.1 2-hydroxyacid dehydrogenase [Flavobacterium gawalongense]
MKIAVFSTKPYDREYLDKFNIENKHELIYFEAPLNTDTTNLAIGFEGVCIFVNDKIDKKTIDKLSEIGIKLIDLRCAGFNNVDIEAATKQNIKVLRVPAYSPQAVAEHAVALILTLNRKTHKAYNRVRESNFSLENLTGFNLYEKTVGVIGTGKIGTAFCQIMLGFGCKVIAYDIKESEQLIAKGVEYKTLDEIFKNSDIISLHCPLNINTKHLFNRAAFSKIKKGAMLINTSRGALIKTSHAIEALKNEQLGYLGIDVYEQEENLFFKDLSESIIQDDLIERLMAFHNVLITPHQGFFTNEALDQIAQTTLKNFTDFENRLPLENEVKL